MLIYEQGYASGRILVFDDGKERTWRLVALLLAFVAAIMIGHQMAMSASRCVSPA